MADITETPRYNRPHGFQPSDAILIVECTTCGRPEGDTIHDLSDTPLTEDEVWARNSPETSL